jgi:hypothetical protein
MMARNKKIQVAVRVLATPKLEIRFGYFMQYEYVYEDIYEYLDPKERRELGSMLSEEVPEFIAYVRIESKKLCEIYDKLALQYAEECARLNNECEELSSLVKENDSDQ